MRPAPDGRVALIIAPRDPGYANWVSTGPIYIGPAFSLASSLVSPALRGRTLAIISVLCNFIGAGIGPQLVGAVSDILRHLGRTDALPLAISTMGIAALASGLLFFLTRRVVPHGLPSPLE